MTNADEHERPTPYTLKRSTRARTMRLSVYPDGSVVVTAPRLFGFRIIERFIEKHAVWIARKVAQTKDKTILRVERGSIPGLKVRALALAHERCAHFAQQYQVCFARIGIGSSKSRWGTCSERGVLNFNFKIALLPERLVDYIVVHELCHLIEFNHSKAFWAQVERCIPDHRSLRKELRKTIAMMS